jgi:hypothetical protein
MDKMRLSVAGEKKDFARFYDWTKGFASGWVTVSLAADKALTIFLTSDDRPYEISVAGDAHTEADIDRDNRGRYTRIFRVCWSNPSLEPGMGKAVVKIFNPDVPKSCVEIKLSVGLAFHHDSYNVGRKVGLQEGADETERRGHARMLAEEAWHRASEVMNDAFPTEQLNLFEDEHLRITYT